MKFSLALLTPLIAASMLACTDATASTAPPSMVVTLTASNSFSSCVAASPDPANIRVGESIAFRNRTGVPLTIVADGFNTPWTVVEPGETSGGIKFSFASTRSYYVQSCGNSAANLHTLVITVN